MRKINVALVGFDGELPSNLPLTDYQHYNIYHVEQELPESLGARELEYISFKYIAKTDIVISSTLHDFTNYDIHATSFVKCFVGRGGMHLLVIDQDGTIPQVDHIISFASLDEAFDHMNTYYRKVLGEL